MIIAGVKKSHSYLYSRLFATVTDHKPLLGLLAPEWQSPQILSSSQPTPIPCIDQARCWATRMPSATCCCPTQSPANYILLIEDLPQPLVPTSNVTTHSATDHTVTCVLNWVWRGWPEGWLDAEFQLFSSHQHELSVHKGCLMWESRPIIPPRLQCRVLEALHDGHPAIVLMKALNQSDVTCG